MGFTEKNDKTDKDFINVVSLVRLICFVFLFGTYMFIQDVYLFFAFCQSKDVFKYLNLKLNMEFNKVEAQDKLVDLKLMLLFKKILTTK